MSLKIFTKIKCYITDEKLVWNNQFRYISKYLDQDKTAIESIHLHEIQIADEFADLKD